LQPEAGQLVIGWGSTPDSAELSSTRSSSWILEFLFLRGAWRNEKRRKEKGRGGKKRSGEKGKRLCPPPTHISGYVTAAGCL